MSLFRKKCEYCKEKIEKDKELFRDIKIPGLIGTRRKPFCSKEHINNYEKEFEDYLKNSKPASCCS